MNTIKDSVVDILVRTLKTFLESMLGFLIAGTAIQSIDWFTAISVSATAAVIAVVINAVSHLTRYINKRDAEAHEEEV